MNPSCFEDGSAPLCLSRRELLFAGALALSTLPVTAWAAPAGTSLLKATHARRRIGRIDTLAVDQALTFDYPRPGISNLLVRLGVPAGAGVGPGADIVAFNLRCTHMGGDLTHTLQAGQQLLGPCPRHLTTFDLTRHGMVTSGSATEALPQIVLEVDGDEVFAVGVMGLVYGQFGTRAPT